MGSVTKPEQTAMYKKRQSNRVEVRGVPNSFPQDKLEELARCYGAVKKLHTVTTETESYYVIIFDTPDEAQKACDHLNGSSLDGVPIKVEMTNNNPASGRSTNYVARPARNQVAGPGNFNNQSAAGNAGRPSVRGGGYPLRVLVAGDFVGALIGRKGQTIRSITQRCKVRVDVHGKENLGMVEKVISIYGQPESCSNALREILQVVQQESANNNRGEVLLKMLANDRFCGRIIGKEGKIIKKIKDDSSTKINISNSQEMLPLFPDRVIAIRGNLEGMVQAEAAISQRLVECIEQDMNSQQAMYGGMVSPSMSVYYNNPRAPYEGPPGCYYPPPPMAASHQVPPPNAHLSRSSVGPGPVHQSQYPRAPYPMHQGGGGNGQQQQSSINNSGSGALGGGGTIVNETLQVCVPSAAVGALIGTQGVSIKHMMRDSGAFINIESKKDLDPSIDRQVSIKGHPDSCWRAAYLVFEKMRMEGYAGNDEVRLRINIEIPKSLVGRVIGKSGKNVKELQRSTGAMLKLPEDPNSQAEMVNVEVLGDYNASRGAISRIRNLMIQTQTLPPSSTNISSSNYQQSGQVYGQSNLSKGGHQRSHSTGGGSANHSNPGQVMQHHQLQQQMGNSYGMGGGQDQMQKVC